MPDDLTDGGRILPRPLRDSERVMDIDTILDAYQWAKDRLMDVVLARRREILRALDASVPYGPVNPVALRRALSVMWTLHELGRMTAAQEAASLGVEIRPLVAAAESGPDGEDLIARLERTSALLERRLAAGDGAPDPLQEPYTRWRSGLVLDERRVQDEWARRA